MLSAEQKIVNVLEPHISKIMCKSILSLSLAKTQVDIDDLRSVDRAQFINEMSKGIRLYVQNPQSHNACIAQLKNILTGENTEDGEKHKRATVHIADDYSIIELRKIARSFSQEIGFSDIDQLKISTAITGIARMVLTYSGKGEVAVYSLSSETPGLEVIAYYRKQSSADVALFAEDTRYAVSFPEWELRGIKRLVDEFDVVVEPNSGFEITLRKYLHCIS